MRPSAASACVCVCAIKSVRMCMCRAVLFPMLSGRLWSHDRQAAPTAAMNHCIIEPPLDKRGEREEAAEPVEGRG